MALSMRNTMAFGRTRSVQAKASLKYADELVATA